MKKNMILILAAFFFVMGLITAGALFLYEPGKAGVLPKLGKAPSFELTDSQNKIFSSDAMKGKVWVADFFFSTCAGPCPTMGKNMQKLHNRFDRDDVRLVNITVYPSHDTPEVLTRYGAKFKADISRWHFLTGEEEEILRISVDGFKIGDPEELFRHSQQFVLIDREGNIRGYYDGVEDDRVEALINDIQALL